MKNYLLYLLFFSCISANNHTYSQIYSADSINSSQTYVIIKHNGVEYIGTILSDDSREVLILTKNLGKIYIPKADIKSIRIIQEESLIVNGQYQQEDPFATRYTFTTSALPIKKGENYALINLYGPEAHFALSDNFSLGIMSSWIVSPLVIAGKYSFKTKKETLNFSIGSLVGSSGYLNNFKGYGGLHFANMTLGTRLKNITFSGGYAYIQTGFFTSFPPEGTIYASQTYINYQGKEMLKPIVQGPVFSVAGLIKVGAKTSFVFDSMIGVFSQKKYGVEISEITPNAENGFNPLQFDISHYYQKTTALFIMPGLRFQSTPKRAFQVSLAGVSAFGWVTKFKGATNNSFPVPMCSWFFKF